MSGFLILAIALAVVAALAASRVLSRRRGFEVRHPDGRRLPGPGLARVLPIAIVVFLVLALAVSSVRVVPVGHALVVFNTVTKGFRLARQGVTFVVPFITATQQYDLRRLEYTMS